MYYMGIIVIISLIHSVRLQVGLQNFTEIVSIIKTD
jgi:hypothetical protein